MEISADGSLDPDLPQIGDGSGYCITKADLSLVRLGSIHVSNWAAETAPLGLDEDFYAWVASELAQALSADGVDAEEVAVYLKGSSTAFFSGPHKRMPLTDDDLVDEFRSRTNRFPEDIELSKIVGRLNAHWPVGAQRPTRPFFDSLYQFGIDPLKSDYDLELRSTPMVKRCEERAGQTYDELTDERFSHPKYRFVRKDVVVKVFRNLRLFEELASRVLRREVTVALFDDDGPSPHSSDEFHPGWLVGPRP